MRYLFLAPSVRKDRILGDLIAFELAELEISGSDQMHCRTVDARGDGLDEGCKLNSAHPGKSSSYMARLALSFGEAEEPRDQTLLEILPYKQAHN